MNISPDYVRLLAEDPELALDPEVIPDREVPHLLAEVEALRAALRIRLLVRDRERWTSGSPDHATPAEEAADEPDRWLTAQEVADRLGMSVKWVYASRYRWERGRDYERRGRALRFSERALEAGWLT